MLSVKIIKVGEQKVSKTGNPYIQQEGWIQLFDQDASGALEPYPRKIKFLCDKSYAPGDYEMAPWSFNVGEYDSLALRLVLVQKGAGGKTIASPAK